MTSATSSDSPALAAVITTTIMPDAATINESAEYIADMTACIYQPTDNIRVKFIVLVIFAPIICLYGVIGSVMAIVVFLRPRMRNANNIYLAWLAVSDIGVLITGGLIYTVEILYDYHRNITLYYMWITYLKTAFFISHFFQVVAVYMTVAATVERSIAVVSPNVAQRVCSLKASLIWSFGICVGCFTFTMPKYFEIEIATQSWCDGFGRYILYMSALAKDKTYNLVHTIYLSSLLVIFIPFLLLLMLNVVITYKMASNLSTQSSGHLESMFGFGFRESRFRRLRRRLLRCCSHISDYDDEPTITTNIIQSSSFIESNSRSVRPSAFIPGSNPVVATGGGRRFSKLENKQPSLATLLKDDHISEQFTNISKLFQFAKQFSTDLEQIPRKPQWHSTMANLNLYATTDKNPPLTESYISPSSSSEFNSHGAPISYIDATDDHAHLENLTLASNEKRSGNPLNMSNFTLPMHSSPCYQSGQNPVSSRATMQPPPVPTFSLTSEIDEVSDAPVTKIAQCFPASNYNGRCRSAVKAIYGDINKSSHRSNKQLGKSGLNCSHNCNNNLTTTSIVISEADDDTSAPISPCVTPRPIRYDGVANRFLSPKDTFLNRRRRSSMPASRKMTPIGDNPLSPHAGGPLYAAAMLNPFKVRIENRIIRMRRREANVVLLVVVTVFLVCNLPDFVLTLMEQVAPKYLERNPDFWSFGKDLVNILTLINSAANFTVYIIFGQEFRRELRTTFCYPVRDVLRRALRKLSRVSEEPAKYDDNNDAWTRRGRKPSTGIQCKTQSNRFQQSVSKNEVRSNSGNTIHSHAPLRNTTLSSSSASSVGQSECCCCIGRSCKKKRKYQQVRLQSTQFTQQFDEWSLSNNCATTTSPAIFNLNNTTTTLMDISTTDISSKVSVANGINGRQIR